MNTIGNSLEIVLRNVGACQSVYKFMNWDTYYKCQTTMNYHRPCYRWETMDRGVKQRNDKCAYEEPCEEIDD